MSQPDRRRFLALASALGVSSALFPEELWRQSRLHPPGPITKKMIQAAARVAGLTFTDAECGQMLDGLQQHCHPLRRLAQGRAEQRCALRAAFQSNSSRDDFRHHRANLSVSGSYRHCHVRRISMTCLLAGHSPCATHSVTESAVPRANRDVSRKA